MITLITESAIHQPQNLNMATAVNLCTRTYIKIRGCWDSLLVERQTHDRKVASLNPGRSGRRIFFPELTLCADSCTVPFHPCVTTAAHKRPWSVYQKCRWQVTPKHKYTFANCAHDPCNLGSHVPSSSVDLVCAVFLCIQTMVW